jgi:hypothetical protein
LTFWSSIKIAVFWICLFLTSCSLEKQFVLFIMSNSYESIWVGVHPKSITHHVMHNFSVIQLQILTLLLPKNTGMNKKEAPFAVYYLVNLLSHWSLSLSFSELNHPLFTKILLPFVSIQIHLKLTIERSIS